MKCLKKLLVFCLFILLGILYTCDKKEVPTLMTTEVTEITSNSAKSGGVVINEGSGTIMTRGVCWSTDLTPTIDNDRTQDGAGAGTYISNISGLNDSTIYYVRAYATNSEGTGYGMVMSFLTSNCMFCKMVTTNNITDEVVSEGSETKYCDAALNAIKSAGSTTVGNLTTIWVCTDK